MSILHSLIQTLQEDEPGGPTLIENYIRRYNNPSVILEDYQKYASWIIKFGLLESALKYLKGRIQVKVLLDLASGRGNDLNRWNQLKIPNILGIEVDKEQYKESVSRLNETIKNYKYGKFPIKVEYVHGSALDTVLVKDSLKKFYKTEYSDIITCNFAMNYFFKNDKTIDEFFTCVVSCLKPGGLFVGTAADGDVIQSLLHFCNGIVNNNLYFIKKSDTAENAYEISLKTPYFESGEKAFTEFYIHKSKLISLCEKYGLIPVKLDRYDPVCNFQYIESHKYKHGIAIRGLFFRFAFIKL